MSVEPLGALYGVGVGPGDPDLMTLRAVRRLREVSVIAIPRRSEFDRPAAWETARVNVGDVPGQERLYLNLPATRDATRRRAAWELVLARIGERLLAGKAVAFITPGDPRASEIFMQLLDEAPRRWPGIRLELVPGVEGARGVPAPVVEVA